MRYHTRMSTRNEIENSKRQTTATAIVCLIPYVVIHIIHPLICGLS